MHDTAMASGRAFADVHGGPGKVVLDIGGLDVNGSLRSAFEGADMKYVCVDIIPHPSVDVVVVAGEALPYETGVVDLVISTSCFEHDPCFWMTFREMCRVVKVGGQVYVNAPANGPYHKHPGDNWRFYSDAGQALAFWSKRKLFPGDVPYPAKVAEVFYIHPATDVWMDFVCVWTRVEDPAEIAPGIVVDAATRVQGPVETRLGTVYGMRTEFPYIGST